ncbi:MAG: hypothetical protein QM765_27070 [Myxococcales bacterium]
MRPTSALTVALVLSTALQARAAAPASLADAKKALEAARGNLTQAVQLIDKDPPSTADLDAAPSAVTALKEAIDAGAKFEADDLDYAKAVLAARKEMRTQREYIDQRRAKVHIFEKRRTIEAQAKSLADKVKALESVKEPGAAFDDARAAIAALKKVVDVAREFTKQDDKFAAFIAETDAAIGRHEKAVDDRLVALSADKQRGLLEQDRKSLGSAVGALNKSSTDTQFEAAEKAWGDLNRRLDEGKFIEPKDRSYKAESDKARAELAASRKKIDDLFAEVGVERLKAEIEPAYKELTSAGKALRGKGAGEDQIAEARTAAIVVRKMVDKYAPQAARSQPFANYLETVKKTLVDVEVDLLRRGLDIAKSAVTQAVRKVEAKAPSEDQFEACNGALANLDKVINDAGKPDSSVAQLVADARELWRTSQMTVSKRRVEVSLGAPVQTATKALWKVEAKSPTPTDADFEAAEKAIAAVEKVVEPIQKPDPSVAEKVMEAKSLVKTGRASIAKRRAEVDLEAARKAVSAALRPVEGKGPSDDHFAELNTALTVLDKTIDSNKDNRDAALALADARELARVARLSMNKRRVEVSLGGPVQAATKALWKVDAKSPVPTDADFDAADKALAEVEAIVAPIQKPDPSVAEKVMEAKSLVKTGRQTLAKRRVEVSLGGPVQDATKAMWKVEAKAPVPTDADFAAATKALDAVEKIVTPIEKPDPSVAQKVMEARSLVKTSRQSLAKRKAEVALQNAQKDVTKALRFVEGKNPTDDHFAEANTAITVLEKTLEEVKANKDASAAIADARQALRDAKASAEKRRIETNLDKPRTAVQKALMKLDGRAPTDADFKAAADALVDLEKTLEPLGKPPSSVAVLVQESRSLLKTGKAAAAKRRLELDVEAQKGKVEDARKAAAQLMGVLFKADKDGVKATEDALKKIIETLDAGVELAKKDKNYAFYEGEVRKRVAEMNERIADRKVVIAGGDGATLLKDSDGERQGQDPDHAQRHRHRGRLRVGGEDGRGAEGRARVAPGARVHRGRLRQGRREDQGRDGPAQEGPGVCPPVDRAAQEDRVGAGGRRRRRRGCRGAEGDAGQEGAVRQGHRAPADVRADRGEHDRGEQGAGDRRRAAQRRAEHAQGSDRRVRREGEGDRAGCEGGRGSHRIRGRAEEGVREGVGAAEGEEEGGGAGAVQGVHPRGDHPAEPQPRAEGPQVRGGRVEPDRVRADQGVHEAARRAGVTGEKRAGGGPEAARAASVSARASSSPVQ